MLHIIQNNHTGIQWYYEHTYDTMDGTVTKHYYNQPLPAGMIVTVVGINIQ